MTSDQADDLKDFLSGELRSFRHELTSFRTEVNQRFDGVEGRLGAVEGRLGAVEGRLTKVEVTQEAMHSDLRAVAEGVTGLYARVDRVRDDVREELHDWSHTHGVSTHMLAHRVDDHDRRLDALESRAGVEDADES